MKTSMKHIAKLMKNVDIGVLTTQTARGALSSRPMSNNGKVDYDGDSYYFTWEESRTVNDLREHSAQVTLSFTSRDKKSYIVVSGKAKVITSKARMAEKWSPDLDQWFEDGVDTEGVVMIHVAAKRIKWWSGEDDGELVR